MFLLPFPVRKIRGGLNPLYWRDYQTEEESSLQYTAEAVKLR
jgi:hypothetical protein